MQRVAPALQKLGIVLIAGGVFLAFLAYAFLAPATYRATALVAVQFADSAKPASAAAAKEKLERVVLDSAGLEALAREEAATPSSAKRGLRAAAEIATSDGRVFNMSFSDATAVGAQRMANALAGRVVKQAPHIFPSPLISAKDREKHLAREQRMRELAAFIAEHPELASEAPIAAPAAGTPETDGLLQSLLVERRKLEQVLAEKAPPDGGALTLDASNPDAGEEASERLRRRLIEVRRAIKGRQQALAQKTPVPAQPAKLPPELRAEWQRLLRAVAEIGAAPSDSPGNEDRTVGYLLAAAQLPQTPVRPNRPLLLFAGALAALAILATFWLVVLIRKQATPAAMLRAGQSGPHKLDSGAPPSAQPSLRDSERRVLEVAPRLASNIPTLIGPANSGVLQAAATITAERAAAEHAGSVIPPPPPVPRPVDEPVPTERNWRPTGSPPAKATDQRAAARTPAGESVNASPRPRRSQQGNHGTLFVGSFSAPDAQERSGPRSSRPRIADSTYRYSSIPAPPSGSKSEKPPSSKPPINVIGTAPGWQPDRTLVLPLHKTLREQLLALALERCVTVIVCGVPPVIDGKSRVAIGLALALAETAHPRILLMEANFHRPAVHRLLGLEIPVSIGFSQQLHARIHAHGEQRWNLIGCSPSLHVLAESVMRSPGMILSKQFEESVRDLQKYYDVIIIDAPDASFEFDCRALDSIADGLILACANPESPEVAHAQALFSAKRYSTVVVAPADA